MQYKTVFHSLHNSSITQFKKRIHYRNLEFHVTEFEREYCFVEFSLIQFNSVDIFSYLYIYTGLFFSFNN